jgi:TP901 family phage tail tape measure protein
MNLFELAVVVSAVDRATSVLNGISGAVKGAAGAAEQLRATGERVGIAGQAITQFSQKVVSGLQSIIQPSNDIQDSLAKVESVMTPMTGTMAQSLEVVKQAAIDWSDAHSDAATKFLDTTYMMISAGLNQTQSIEATRTATLVAKATMGDSTEAANLIGGAYNTMGDKAKPAAQELGRLGDVVTKTQQQFQFANFGQLAEGLKNSTSAALNTGLSFEQLNTVIGTLNSNQLQGAEAGTAFKAALLNMNKASTDLKFSIAKTSSGGIDFIGTLANIEKKFGSLRDMSPKMQQAFRAAFGDEGYNAISLLLGKSGELQKSLEQVTDSTGAAAKAAAVMGSTGSEQTKVLSNQMIGLKDAVATQLRPQLEALAGIGANAIKWLTAFAKEHPNVVAVAGALALILAVVTGIAGPVLMAVGAFQMYSAQMVMAAAANAAMSASAGAAGASLGAASGGAWAFTAALLANPITWIVVAIVAAAVLIYKYWGPIKGFFVGVWDGIKGAWGAVVGFFTGIWANIKSAFQESFIKGVITVLSYITIVGIFIRIFAAVWPWLKALGPKFLSALADVGLAFVSFFLALPQNIMAGLGMLGSLALAALSGLGSIVMSALSGIGAALMAFFGQGIRNDLGAIWVAIQSFVSGFSLYDAGVKILSTLTNGIKAMAMMPVDAMKSVVQRVRNLLPFSPAKDGPLRDLHRIRLVETIAQTVRAAPLVSALSTATAAAVAAVPTAAMVAPVSAQAAKAPSVPSMSIQTTPAPTVAPLAAIGPARKPPGGGADAGGAGGDGAVQVHFHIAGSADASTVAQLDEWAKRNGPLLHRIVKTQQERDKRSDFG